MCLRREVDPLCYLFSSLSRGSVHQAAAFGHGWPNITMCGLWLLRKRLIAGAAISHIAKALRSSMTLSTKLLPAVSMTMRSRSQDW